MPNQILKTKNGYQGFFIDLFKILEKKLQVKFKYVYYHTWCDLINSAKKGEIDIVFAAQKTPSRLNYLHFTDTVLIQQNMVLENINAKKINSIKELFGKKVAVTKGSAISEYLQAKYPQIRLIQTHSELEALKLLNSKKVSAAIAETVRANYYIQKHNLNDIFPAFNLNYNYYLKIATNIKEPVLNIIISKALNSIPQDKMKALKLKWGYIKEKVVIFDKKTMIFIALLFTIIIAFLIYLHTINRKLKREILKKEQALKRLKRLRDSKLNQINQAISIIAHQWKQPLNTLKALNELLIKEYKLGKLDEKALKQYETNSKKQIEYMINTINDFKEIFKIKENKKTFNLKEIIDLAIDECQAELQKSNIKIKLNTRNITLKGYPNTLKQLLINLISNAKDALNQKNPKNKEIKISLKQDDFITIEIEDNAGGIPIEIIDKIFEPYFTTKKEGTGLGLYMTKIILEEKMNATIDVENTKKGAKFTIKIKPRSEE
ncbi:ATP-binding protein [Caminibacter pacificus]